MEKSLPLTGRPWIEAEKGDIVVWQSKNRETGLYSFCVINVAKTTLTRVHLSNGKKVSTRSNKVTGASRLETYFLIHREDLKKIERFSVIENTRKRLSKTDWKTVSDQTIEEIYKLLVDREERI